MHRVIRSFLAAAVVLSLNILSPGMGAQPVDAVNPAGAANLRATSAFTPRGEAAPLPLSNFSVQRGIGIVADDGNSYWPGYPSDLRAPATFRVVPASGNTFTVRRVAYQFDDPSTGVVLFDGAARPIVGYLDANYIPPTRSRRRSRSPASSTRS